VPVRVSRGTPDASMGELVRTTLKASLLAATAILVIGANAPAYAQATATQPAEPAAPAQPAQPAEPEQAATPAATPAPAAPTPSASTNAQTVVVTGSRIRRDTFTSAAPVTVITTQEVRQTAENDITETLQRSVAAGGSEQINNLYGGFVADGGPGV
jgi:outer membrane receptor protein involved in Fe transport